MPKLNIVGDTYSYLKVLEEVDSKPRKGNYAPRRRFRCGCVCGKEIIVSMDSLRTGHTKSCGCVYRQKHGLTHHKLYEVWANIKNRCYCPNHPLYSDYGARGIIMCPEWKNSFQDFYDFCIGNGWEKGLQIDRIDNNGIYSPDNCRFVNNRVNSLNTRLLSRANKSGYVGVCWSSRDKVWRAYIRVKGNSKHIGRYKDKKQAVEARNAYIASNGLEHEYRIQPYKEGRHET